MIFFSCSRTDVLSHYEKDLILSLFLTMLFSGEVYDPPERPISLNVLREYLN